MAIETAVVAPVLAMMIVGTFEVSSMIARQVELQSAASEAEAIALAAKPDTAAKLATLKNVIMTSTGLSAAHVTVTNKYRCSDAAVLVTTDTACGSGVAVWTYVDMGLTTTYTPTWTHWGFGQPVDYNVRRQVMIS